MKKKRGFNTKLTKHTKKPVIGLRAQRPLIIGIPAGFAGLEPKPSCPS